MAGNVEDIINIFEKNKHNTTAYMQYLCEHFIDENRKNLVIKGQEKTVEDKSFQPFDQNQMAMIHEDPSVQSQFMSHMKTLQTSAPNTVAGNIAQIEHWYSKKISPEYMEKYPVIE